MRKEIVELLKDFDNMDNYPKPVSIEYDPFDLALPDAKLTSKRLHEYILAQEVGDLSWQRMFGQFRADGSVPFDLFTRNGHKNIHVAFEHFYCIPINNLGLFEWQHSAPNYDRIIQRGIRGCLDDIKTSKALHANDKAKLDFLDALEEVCYTMIEWAHKCADECIKAAESASEERKLELKESAERLYRVPEYPAETFKEALQSIYICYDMLPDSVGTIDRYLFPYYDRDIKNGTLTRDEAKDYLQEFFFRLQCRTPINSINRKRGGECHFAIGGYLPGGEDGFTDLSRLIVEALMEMPMHIPEISLRWTKKTPREVLRFMLDCERNDPYKRIAFVNDEPRIKGFIKNIGLSWDDAIKYSMVGCNEPAFPGAVWMGGTTANLVRCLTNLLYDHSEEAISAKTFEEFFTIFEKYFASDIDELIVLMDKYTAMRSKDISVLSSILLDGCIESATSPTQGGCKIKLGGAELMGITCLIDSLSMIKQFVYDEKLYTMEELIENLKSDWEKDPDMHTVIYKTGKFFGNNEELSDKMAVRVTDLLYKYTHDRRLMFGERIVFGTLAGYNPHFATFGKLTPATPDGRYSGDAFMVGAGQTGGKDRKGLTSLFASVSQMHPSGILSGPFLMNVTLDAKLIKDDKYFEKTVEEIETYFAMGGMHIQLNYVTAEELLEARKCPEKHGNLKVRVSGFSGVFVELDERIQNNVIDRTVKESV